MKLRKPSSLNVIKRLSQSNIRTTRNGRVLSIVRPVIAISGAESPGRERGKAALTVFQEQPAWRWRAEVYQRIRESNSLVKKFAINSI
jgi:hypothetical protein